MATISRVPPLFKLLGKLRNVVAVPPMDRPRRPWDSAGAREIQLELDLESSYQIRQRMRLVEAGATKDGEGCRGPV